MECRQVWGTKKTAVLQTCLMRRDRGSPTPTTAFIALSTRITARLTCGSGETQPQDEGRVRASILLFDRLRSMASARPKYAAHHVTSDVGGGEFLAQFAHDLRSSPATVMMYHLWPNGSPLVLPTVTGGPVPFRKISLGKSMRAASFGSARTLRLISSRHPDRSPMRRS
jgi:hypothetical protein